MKFSEAWLREWANPSLTREQISEKLTMAGLEIEEIVPLDNSIYLFDVSITPNRGDCLSILGMAKEVAALTECELTSPVIPDIQSVITDTLPVTIHAKDACPRYVGRIIRQIKTNIVTPAWLQERLTHAGVSCIHPIVDVTNFVMLELGQPMHAFSLDKIEHGIQVRQATSDEPVIILDGTEIQLNHETVVIADSTNILAIAGVMGGLNSSVTAETQDIFLESAYFAPTSIARAGRRYHLSSDSAYRFERGVDPTIQRLAIERATQLILDIVGGQPGPIIEVNNPDTLPQPARILLRSARIEKILGFALVDELVEKMLLRLDFICEKIPEGWNVTVPARRSDITIEVDLIEEIARLYGYDHIPCNTPHSSMQMNPTPESQLSLFTMRRGLCDLGYQEVVTYSFIDKKIQTLFEPAVEPKELLNPITAEMDVMRTSLWPGLVNTLLYNQNRQQSRIRLFETGLRFIKEGDNLNQQSMLSGLISGEALPEQWGVSTRQADFFDLKGDLQNLFKLTFAGEEFTFVASKHAALHPGQTAEIYRNNKLIGIMGALHPSLTQSLKIENKVFLFELVRDALETAKVPNFSSISRFPEIRRDLAFVLDEVVSAADIQAVITSMGGELLKEINIFDIYQGKGITPGRKSIALALTLQHSSRTLIDEEVTNLVDQVIVALKGRFNAELRG